MHEFCEIEVLESIINCTDFIQTLKSYYLFAQRILPFHDFTLGHAFRINLFVSFSFSRPKVPLSGRIYVRFRPCFIIFTSKFTPNYNVQYNSEWI